MKYTPGQLAAKRRQLALEYKEKMKEIAELRQKKAIRIIELLAEHKTVSKAELYYNAEDNGQKLIELEFYCKGLLELMRSVKTEADIKHAESFGQY